MNFVYTDWKSLFALPACVCALVCSKIVLHIVLESNIICNVCFGTTEHSDLLVIFQISLWCSDEYGNISAVVKECGGDDQLEWDASGGGQATPHLKALHSKAVRSVKNPASLRIFVSC